jgi:hypothetical protein
MHELAVCGMVDWQMLASMRKALVCKNADAFLRTTNYVGRKSDLSMSRVP